MYSTLHTIKGTDYTFGMVKPMDPGPLIATLRLDERQVSARHSHGVSTVDLDLVTLTAFQQ